MMSSTWSVEFGSLLLSWHHRNQYQAPDSNKNENLSTHTGKSLQILCGQLFKWIFLLSLTRNWNVNKKQKHFSYLSVHLTIFQDKINKNVYSRKTKTKRPNIIDESSVYSQSNTLITLWPSMLYLKGNLYTQLLFKRQHICISTIALYNAVPNNRHIIHVSCFPNTFPAPGVSNRPLQNMSTYCSYFECSEYSYTCLSARCTMVQQTFHGSYCWLILHRYRIHCRLYVTH